MANYVQVDNNVVTMKFENTLVANNLISQGKTIIEVTDMEPQPTIDWTYENGEFDMPSIPHALIEDNKVVKISTLNYVESWYMNEELGEVWISLKWKRPVPEVGWSYIDEKFIAP